MADFDITFYFTAMFLWIPVLILSLTLTAAQQDNDLIKSLPGLTFETNFKSYSGYLNANEAGTWKMHYMLTESKSDPANDPILVWFNGGPGCSSLGGLFNELGPFYINKDAQTLFENPYAWNARANVLYLESPIGVGFSYSTVDPYFNNGTDDMTAEQNYRALDDFFKRVQPQFGNRTFFLSGESYAGIYIPVLTKRIMQGINEGDFSNPYFKGSAIGNGCLHEQYDSNSKIVHAVYNGYVLPEEWDLIKTTCGIENESDIKNFQLFSSAENCTVLVSNVENNPDNNGYNYYQDCYTLQNEAEQKVIGENPNNNPDYFNYGSTDSHQGYPCYDGASIAKYLNRPEVQDSLNIDRNWKEHNNGSNIWQQCPTTGRYMHYKTQHPTTNQFFHYVIQNSQSDFRFLLYNGDADMVCPYIGNRWFVQDVVKDNNMESIPRELWTYGKQNVGFNEHYNGTNQHGKRISVDMLSAKGAGHFVPLDRPGPSLQMINNFLFPEDDQKAVNYSRTEAIGNNPLFSPPLRNNSATFWPQCWAFVFAISYINSLMSS